VLRAWTLRFRESKQEDNGDVESKSDKSTCEDMPPWEDYNKDELVLPVEDSLVIRHNLQV
jgi:hypothetical protein